MNEGRSISKKYGQATQSNRRPKKTMRKRESTPGKKHQTQERTETENKGGPMKAS